MPAAATRAPADPVEREPLEADRRGQRERHQWRQRERERAHRRGRGADAHVVERGRDHVGDAHHQCAEEVRAARERDVQRDRQARKMGTAIA